MLPTYGISTEQMKTAYRGEFIASGDAGVETGDETALPRQKTLWVGRKSGYNEPMAIVVFFMRLLEVLFFVGLVGSSVVVLISFVEDGKELFGEDEPSLPRG